MLLNCQALLHSVMRPRGSSPAASMDPGARGGDGFLRCSVSRESIRRICSFVVLSGFVVAAYGIEAPKPQAPPPEPEPARGEDVGASDQSEFHETLQRSAHTVALRGLKIPSSVIESLARGAADDAIAELSALAAQGEHDANVALVRIQHWCNRIASSRLGDPQDQIAKLSAALTAERASKAAGVIRAEAAYVNRARAACGAARFDYGGIEARLRQAAAAGHPASAVELAQFVRDPQERAALLQSAVDQDYAPAMYAVATSRLIAVQRGQTTENVSSIRLLLKQAGRSLPKAKLDLANCMALGCDGHPADSSTARAFGLDAARDGEPAAFLSMVRMPWGGRLSRTQHLAWQYFGRRLNESGCSGEAYVRTATAFAQTIATLERGQDRKLLDAAEAQAETLWRDNGERAMTEQGCAREPGNKEAASRRPEAAHSS